MVSRRIGLASEPQKEVELFSPGPQIFSGLAMIHVVEADASTADNALPATPELPSTVRWGGAVEGVQVGLCLDQTSYKGNEEIIAYVVLTNTSSEAHVLPGVHFSDSAFPPLTFIVVGPDRAPLAPAFEPRVGPLLYRPRPMGRTLGAHEAITETDRLRDRYDFLQTGEYTVWAKTIIWEINPPKQATPIELISELVSVRIEGGPPKLRSTDSRPSAPSAAPSLSGSLPESVRSRMPPELQERMLARQRELAERHAAFATNRPSERTEATAPQTAPPPLAVKSLEMSNGKFPISRQTALALVAILMTALLAILWRAARRKPEG